MGSEHLRREIDDSARVKIYVSLEKMNKNNEKGIEKLKFTSRALEKELLLLRFRFWDLLVLLRDIR
jgi:hypothetical protein